MLCVDSDVVLPRDLLTRLFKLCEAGAGIATGWYIKKIPGENPVVAGTGVSTT